MNTGSLTMKWLRIFSTLIDDGEHQSDDKCHLVINVKINKNKKIEQNIEFFGYQRDWDEDSGTYLKYPFILELSIASGCAANIFSLSSFIFHCSASLSQSPSNQYRSG